MALDTYKTESGSGGRTSSTQYVYDPTTGKWVASSTTNSNGTTTQPSSKPTASSNSSSSSIPSSPSLPPSDGVPSSSKQTESKDKADKEFIETEFNTLTGDLSLTSTEKSTRIVVNDTVKLEGLGKYLSGLYFVSSVKRTLSKDSGYTHSLSLIKNGFGSSLKKPIPVIIMEEEEKTSKTPSSSSSVKPAQPTVVTRKEEVPKPSPSIQVGDSVRIVGASATYSNASDGVKVPEWVKKQTLTVDKVSSDGTRVLLSPIFSWTYVSNVQKV